MSISLYKGKSSACPSCGSSSVRLAIKSEHPQLEFVTLKAFRVCEACGTVFEPATSRRARHTVSAIGILCGLWLAIAFAVPSLRNMLADGDWSVMAIGACVLHVLAVIGLLQIAYACAKPGRSSQSQRGHRPPM